MRDREEVSVAEARKGGRLAKKGNGGESRSSFSGRELLLSSKGKRAHVEKEGGGDGGNDWSASSLHQKKEEDLDHPDYLERERYKSKSKLGEGSRGGLLKGRNVFIARGKEEKDLDFSEVREKTKKEQRRRGGAQGKQDSSTTTRTPRTKKKKGSSSAKGEGTISRCAKNERKF